MDNPHLKERTKQIMEDKIKAINDHIDPNWPFEARMQKIIDILIAKHVALEMRVDLLSELALREHGENNG